MGVVVRVVLVPPAVLVAALVARRLLALDDFLEERPLRAAAANRYVHAAARTSTATTVSCYSFKS